MRGALGNSNINYQLNTGHSNSVELLNRVTWRKPARSIGMLTLDNKLNYSQLFKGQYTCVRSAHFEPIVSIVFPSSSLRDT